jgi:hypothetical protein
LSSPHEVRRLVTGLMWPREDLTTTGWRRVRQWRQEWLARPSPVIPAVIALTRSRGWR